VADDYRGEEVADDDDRGEVADDDHGGEDLNKNNTSKSKAARIWSQMLQ